MRKRDEIGEGIEELLKRLRKEKGYSYIEVVSKLHNKNITEKDVRKWEAGLKYPDLDMVYELSELYQIPSEKFVEAKNNSYEKGYASINMYTVKWICYFLDVSMKVGFVLMILFYVFTLTFALFMFRTIASNVRR